MFSNISNCEIFCLVLLIFDVLLFDRGLESVNIGLKVSNRAKVGVVSVFVVSIVSGLEINAIRTK